MEIRRYKSDDCKHLTSLFYDTVHSVNAVDYSDVQLDVWAPKSVDFAEWDKTLSANFTVVAEENGVILGFGDIDKTGYLNRLFVQKDNLRRGIATAICDELEKAVDVGKITVHSSLTAKQFFLKRGYKTVKEQQVNRNGVYLTNFVMVKQIGNTHFI